MTKRFTIYLSISLTVGLLGSCSRPVAYFQPEQRIRYTASTPLVAAKTDVVTQSVTLTTLPATAATANELGNSTNTAVNQVEAYVRNDAKLTTNKQLGKRLDRLKHLLPGSGNVNAVASTSTTHKMSVLERLMMKKLNKKINKHLSPNNPKKPMSNGGLLAGGAVLLLGGILLMILSTGTASTIGLIAAIIGLLALIFGLLAS